LTQDHAAIGKASRSPFRSLLAVGPGSSTAPHGCRTRTGQHPQHDSARRPQRTRRKIKHRDTREVIIGGVLGPITRPDVVIAGPYRGDDLAIVGRTVPLHPRQAAELGKLLQPAKPGHPWPDQISSQRWGGKDSKKPLTKVEPLVVAEVTADTAQQAVETPAPPRST
jgi:hypothetical protein